MLTSIVPYLSLVVLLLTIVPVHAYWILTHHSLVTQRLDPIFSGNNVSAHAHAFVGDAAILGDAQNTTCTTSVVKDDRSRYWAPQLYYYGNATRTFDPVPLGFVNTYYLNRNGSDYPNTTITLHPYPEGLRMVAGNSMQFNGPLPNAQAANAINFVCLNYQNGTTFSATMPTGISCPDGLRFQMVFPSCWNGVDLDSPDHQSHVSYPNSTHPDNGDCPSTHPVKFMTLFYEYVYSTNNLVTGSNGTMVLANGDTQGYSFHADFINGWNTTTLTAAINQCTGQIGGNVQQCPPFQASIQQEDAGTVNYCRAQPVVQGENDLAYGQARLPGCNPIRNGPYAGLGACSGTNATTIVSNSSSTASTPALPSGFSQLPGCFYDQGARTLNTQAYSNSSNTPATCASQCRQLGYRYAGVEYGSECWCGNYILNAGAGSQAAASDCNMSCSGDANQACGAGNRLQIYKDANWKQSVYTVQRYDKWNFTDCLVDQSSPRTLNTGLPATSTMTVQTCLDTCAAKNMTYCGMEYSGQCYGGMQTNLTNTAPSVGSSDPLARGCNMPCAGNSSEACGGSWRLNVYTYLSNQTPVYPATVQLAW